MREAPGTPGPQELQITMKFFIAFALIAVASAAVTKPTQLAGELAEIGQIVAAIQSPSTDPATAAALEAMLLDTLGLSPAPISVGPAIVETNPISVGPAIIDFPLPDGGAVTAVEPAVVNPSPVVEPSPVVIGEIPSGASPLVQIIVNVNKQESAAVVPTPADNAVVEEVYVPGPVNVVDHVIAPEPIVEPIQVAEPVLPGPVNVVDNVVVEPVQVVEPIVVQPVIVGTPIIPAPAVVPIDTLN